MVVVVAVVVVVGPGVNLTLAPRRKKAVNAPSNSTVPGVAPASRLALLRLLAAVTAVTIRASSSSPRVMVMSCPTTAPVMSFTLMLVAEMTADSVVSVKPRTSVEVVVIGVVGVGDSVVVVVDVAVGAAVGAAVGVEAVDGAAVGAAVGADV